MKFYSSILNKFYDTEEECLADEKKYEELTSMKQQNLERQTTISDDDSKNQDNNQTKVDSNEKKQCVKKIEEADRDLELEYLKYTEAKKKVIDLKKKNDAECEKILTDARKSLKDAQDKKFAAVQLFNEKYGPYKVSYTGEKALQEMRRHIDMSNDFLSWFFPFFNW